MKFRTCLNTLGINLTAAEVNDLVQKYRADTGLINYKSFCETINHVFTENADKGGIIEGAKSQAVSVLLLTLSELDASRAGETKLGDG